jgi:hypothetical protein
MWKIIIFVFICVSIPYLIGAYSGGEEHVFGGFFINISDGNSYLAKMRQGLEGNWNFVLPYTANPGDSAYIFLYYIFLGHVARILGWTLLFTFHLARLANTLILLVALFIFFGDLFPDQRMQNTAYTLSALGSGMGWIFQLFGMFTSDFWVAEAYPFLSAYANAHFPLGIAMLLLLINPSSMLRSGQEKDWLVSLKFLFTALLLSVIAPFYIPVVVVVRGGMFLWKYFQKEHTRTDFYRLLWIGIGSGPIILYYFWITMTHPVLSGWNEQNLTGSPPLGDLLISFSPGILLAVPGLYFAWKRRTIADRLLISWVLLGTILMYIPFGLQRRFISAFYIPVIGLAVLGLQQLAELFPVDIKRLYFPVLFLVLPTNVLIIFSAFFGVINKAPEIYLTNSEVKALSWINEEIRQNALFLTGPESGLYVPAFSHGRVIYGHPFETVDAEVHKELVTRFYSGTLTIEQMNDLVSGYNVDYIYWGPREEGLGTLEPQDEWQLVYSHDDVLIYKIQDG